MNSKTCRTIIAWLMGLASGGVVLQDGCGGGFGDDCIGPDGYNWCIAGGGIGEIHEPSVQPWDFSDY